MSTLSLTAAGNTTNPALLILRSKGYDLWMEEAGDGATLYGARQAHREFLGYSAAELLGLVTLWEQFGEDWNRQSPDVLGELLESCGAT